MKVVNSKTILAALNSISSAVNYLSTVVATFLANPLILGFIGLENFGIWKFLQNFFGYSALLDGRTNQALKWTIANKKETKEYTQDNLQEDIGAAAIIWAYFIPLMIASGAAGLWLLPRFIEIHSDQVMYIRICAGILLAQILFSPLLNIPEAVLIGTNKYHKTLVANPAVTVLTSILYVVVTGLGASIIGLISVAFFTKIFKTLWYQRIIKKNIPWFGLKKPNRERKKTFLNFSMDMFLWTIINKFIMTGDLLIIGALMTTELVGKYSINQYAIQVGVGLTGLMVSAASPGLGHIVGRKDYQKIATVRRELINLNWMIFQVIGAVYIALNASFMRLWIGQNTIIGTVETLLIFIICYQYSLIRNESSIIDLTLNIRKKVIAGLLSSILSIALCLVLHISIGTSLASILISFIIGRMILVVYYPYHVRQILYINDDKQGFIRKLITSFIIVGVSLTVAGTIYDITKNWYLFIGYSLLIVVVSSLISLTIGLDRQERKMIVGRIKLVSDKKFGGISYEKT